MSVIHDVMACIFGPASCIVNGSLALSAFWVGPPFVGSYRFVCFRTGQPLGYYGSWALFSLSHHYLVWLAAWIVDSGRRTPFTRYALLGDDIVIADGAGAEQYRRLLGKLDVSISESKSICSKTGALEFAKQFWVDKVSVNLSPVSAKAVLSATTLIGLCQLADKYALSRTSLFRLAGAGFRVRSRLLSHRLSRRWKRLRAVSDKSLSYLRLPLDLWFGRGNPINPYYEGIITEEVRRRCAVKQLIVPPSDILWSEGERQNLEYTLYQGWMRSWLEWWKWYCTVPLGPNPSLEDRPPVAATSWKRTVFDNDIKMYGILWKVWDIGEDWEIGTTPPCLVTWPSTLDAKYAECGSPWTYQVLVRNGCWVISI